MYASELQKCNSFTFSLKILAHFCTKCNSFFRKRFCFLFTYSSLFILLCEIQFLIAFQQNYCITYRYGSSISNPQTAFSVLFFHYEVLQNGDRKWTVPSFLYVESNALLSTPHPSSQNNCPLPVFHSPSRIFAAIHRTRW